MEVWAGASLQMDGWEVGAQLNDLATQLTRNFATADEGAWIVRSPRRARHLYQSVWLFLLFTSSCCQRLAWMAGISAR
jgi:hypothetical protein